MAAEYGSDISCLTDLDPNLTVVDGETALFEAVVRRWDTPPLPFEGGLFYDASYGYGIRRLLNTPIVASRVQGGLESEALKDDRVAGCQVLVEVLVRNDDEKRRPPVKITSLIIGAQRDAYKLSVLVSDVTVKLLREESE